ncbi:MAG: hypothetical protein R3C15_08450 [Thermoleophilia bacterium]
MRTIMRRAVVGLGALALGAAVAGPAAGAKQTTLEKVVESYLTACPSPRTSQPFLPWGDSAPYALVEGGDFEPASGAWTLAGGAAVVAGNEPFYVSRRKDAQSLSLPAGGSATSPAFCVSIGTPTFRLFVRNGGDPDSTLGIDVGLVGASGVTWSRIATVKAGAAWGPSGVLWIGVPFWSLDASGTATVVLRLTPEGAGAWQVDDLFLDPFKR